MPKKKQPKTLKKLVTFAMAQHWDKICYGCGTFQQMNDLVESNKYLDAPSLFEHFPSSLLEDLLEGIGTKRSLSRKYFHMLLLEQLRNINLGFGIGEIYYSLFFLRRCTNLRSVSFSYLRHIEPSEFLKIIPFLPQIVSINLQMTLIMDDVLEILSLHCPNLGDLNLISTLVSDNGIVALSGFRRCSGLLRCQKLKRLLVTDTRVTWVGALHALQNFPDLTDFDFDKIFKVFEHIDEEFDQNSKIKLRSMYSTANSVRCVSVENAAKMCPNVEILSVNVAWMDNELLYNFMLFENLRTVTLTNGGNQTVDYDEGVLPVLQICGPQLENLILTNFKSIDIISLGKTCPKLKKMALSGIDEYKVSEDGRPISGIYCELTILELWFDTKTENLTTPVLLQLLSYCKNLTNLLVKKSSSISLELLTKIWDKNPMKYITRLTFDECVNVELNLLQTILDMKNEITVLRIWSCPKVTSECRNTIQNQINNENLDVYFEWFQ